jgi:hypothetical protein
MPLLLEDLAEETSASNRRAAERLEAEARELDHLRHVPDLWEELRHHLVMAAQLMTEWVISRVAEAEGVWRTALVSLRQQLPADNAVRLLRGQLEMVESTWNLARAARGLWTAAEKIGVVPERVDELDSAERRFLELAAEVKRALEHRIHEWQPADPDRLAQGLQLAHEGKTVKADEARVWFRREPS